jgi:hypothetical protein
MIVKPNLAAELFLQTARGYLGFRSTPGGKNDFAVRSGYTAVDVPWSGSFIDCVAYDSGVKMPACVYTPNGLAEFIYQQRWRKDPRPGDIVFYNFAIDRAFGMPHVGIVSNTDGWISEEIFIAIEANICSGLPRASTANDGIFERTRHRYDTLGFCRPFFDVRPAISEDIATGSVEVVVSQLLPGKRHASVAVLQRALVISAGLKNYESGKYDRLTQAAYARFQRSIGLVGDDANGIPTPGTLRRLAIETGVFKI